jgi:hypothetical protein
MRVAAVLWQQAPDDALTAAATGGGAVGTRSALATVVRRMVDDSRASIGVGAFYRWWLDLDQVAQLKKDPMLFPAFTPELQADETNETLSFSVDTTLIRNGSFQDLMTARWSYVNWRLARVYGLTGVTSEPLVQTQLPPGRAGLLTQPALQALGSFAIRNSPSHRGSYIARKFLCEAVPSAPPNVPALALAPGETVRQALRQEVVSATCMPCHAWLDPLGYPFEAFDAIGAPRTNDNGGAIDDTAMVRDLATGFTLNVTDAADLAWQLSTFDTAEACMVRQWLTYALGRPLSDDDEPSVTTARAAFGGAGFNLKALIVAVLTSDAFLTPPP